MATRTIVATAVPRESATRTAGVVASRPPTNGITSVNAAKAAKASALGTRAIASSAKVKMPIATEVMIWPRR